MAKKKKDDLPNGLDEESIKRIINNIKKAQEETSTLSDAWESFSTTLFGIAGSSFWSKAEKTAKTLVSEAQRSSDAIADLRKRQLEFQQQLDSGFDDFSTNFQNRIGGLAASFGPDSFSILPPDEKIRIIDAMQDIGNESLGFLNNVHDTEDKYQAIRAILDGNHEALLEIEGVNAQLLSQSEDWEGSLDGVLTSLEESESRLRRVSSEIANSEAYTLDLGKAWGTWKKNFVQGSIKNLFEVNKSLKEIQRNTGIMMSESMKFRPEVMTWTTEMQAFGVGIQEATQFLGMLQEGLRTTRSKELMGITDVLKEVRLATGLSLENTAELGSEMLRSGLSVKAMKDNFELANSTSKMLGQNSRRVMEGMTKHIDKMRTFGFGTAYDDLLKMAAKSEMLRINMDEVFGIAEQARTLEGALDMAAQLQLAGGSFSNINPMDLLAAARKGPDELTSLLTKMGQDIGQFNEKGEFQINPIDRDRLKIVADATGESLESLTDRIRQSAMIARKTEFFPDSIFENVTSAHEDLDAMMGRGMLANILSNEGGKVSIDFENLDSSEIDLLSDAGINKYEDINESTIREYINLKKAEMETLKVQAEANADLKMAFDNFIASMMNAFTIVEPVFSALAQGIQFLNQNLGGFGKLVSSVLVLAIPKALSLVGNFSKKLFGGIFGKFSGVLGFGKGGGIKGFFEGLRGASRAGKKIDLGGIAKGAAAIAILSASVIPFAIGMNMMGGEDAWAKFAQATLAMGAMMGGVALISNIASKGIDMKGVLLGSLAMAVIGASIIPFAFAMNMMAEVQWPAVVAGLGFMLAAVGMTFAIGALMAGPQAALLGAGLLVLLGVGGTMILVATSLLIAGSAFEKLASVDWSGIERMGSALMSAAPGMMAFAFSAMAFANPISMIGMGLMVGQLLLLSGVMVPLSIALEKSSDSMDRFVESIRNLKGAVNDLDSGSIGTAFSKMEASIEKLDMGKIKKVKEIAAALSKATKDSSASDISRLVEALDKFGKNVNQRGDRKTKLDINLKLNGRDIKNFINEDTELLT